jgi:chemotaxis response regulator CheB
MLRGMTCVIAAVSSAARPRISAILRGWELRFVDSGSELVKALADRAWDMMILEVHFNRHAAAAALKCALSGNASFPVVCVRHAPFANRGHAALDALRMTLGAVGAHAFVDLLEYAEDEAGNVAARALLEGLLPMTA